METLKEKYYPASQWGPKAFWEVTIDQNTDGELYLGLSVVKLTKAGEVTDRLPFAYWSGPIKLEGHQPGQLKTMRRRCQEKLLARMGSLSWDYDREALHKEYRWNEELYKKDAMIANDPDWLDKEPYWDAWYSIRPWMHEDEIEFEEWMERMKREPTPEFQSSLEHFYWIRDASRRAAGEGSPPGLE